MMIGPLRMAKKEESAILPPLTARYRHLGDILLHLRNCLFLRKFAEFIQGIVEVGDAGSGTRPVRSHGFRIRNFSLSSCSCSR